MNWGSFLSGLGGYVAGVAISFAARWLCRHKMSKSIESQFRRDYERMTNPRTSGSTLKRSNVFCRGRPGFRRFGGDVSRGQSNDDRNETNTEP